MPFFASQCVDTSTVIPLAEQGSLTEAITLPLPPAGSAYVLDNHVSIYLRDAVSTQPDMMQMQQLWR